QPGARVVRVTLQLVLLAQRRLERLLFGGRPVPALRLDAVALDGSEHAGGLLTAHHADARVRPHPQEARRVRATAHAVIAGAEAAADDDGEFRHLGGRHRGHHLGAVPGDAFVLVLAPDHETGDVLQEHQRNLALAAQLDEVRALLRRLGKQDAVVRDDAHRHAFDVCEAAHQRGAIARLELVKLAGVDDAGNDFVHIEGLARVGRDHAVQLVCCEFRGNLRPQALGYGLFLLVFVTTERASASACASFCARWSATPDSRVCTSPPPRSSAETISPIAAFTSGGPPRKMVPWSFTMMVSSLIAGT